MKLRAWARTATFHIFDPLHIEDVVDRDLPRVFHAEDKLAAVENGRRGAQKARLK